MNYSTAIFLINANARALLCTYEAEDAAKRQMFKTFDASIKVGDFVIVPTDTRHKMTVCKVTDVDADIDFDSPAQIGWIIGKVDRSGYETTMSQEGDAIAAIKSAERTKKRNELRYAMLADSADALKALPITVMNTEAIEAPKA